MSLHPNPLHDHINNVINMNAFTPDTKFLRDRFEFVPLFSYGTERYGFSNYLLMQGMPRIGIGVTASKEFTLNTFRMGRTCEPVVLYEGTREICTAVRGDVFLVTPEVINDLDQSYNNGIFFRRSKRAVYHFPPNQIAARNKNVHYTVCYMYIGDPAVWIKKRISGEISIGGMYTSNADPKLPYYEFTYGDDLANRNDTHRAF